MIPEVESIYTTTSEAKLKNVATGKHRSTSPSTEDGQPVTAWQRYQQFLALMEASGEKIDRKLMLEAMFRGNDLAYSNH